MTVRRALGVAAVAASAALWLSGCGGGGDDDDNDGGRSATSPSTGLTDGAKRAPAPAGVRTAKGEVTYCAGAGEADAVRRFNSRFASRGLSARRLSVDARPRGCDVMSLDVTRIAELAARRWLLDVTDYVKRRMGEFIPATLATARYDGEKYWAVPKETDAGLLYYRSDQLDSSPPTWQAVYDEARQADGIVYPGAPGEDLTVSFLELAYAAGGKVLTDDGRHATIDSAENLRALRLMVDGVRARAAPKAVTTYTDADARRAFDAGHATFLRGWPAAYASARRSPRIHDTFGAASFPPFDGGRASAVLGGRDLAISAFSDDPQAALALVDDLTSAEAVVSAAERHGIAPPLEAAYDEPSVRRALPYADELHSAVRQARPRPVTPVYQQVSAAIWRNVGRALSGRQSPQDALAKAQNEIEEAL